MYRRIAAAFAMTDQVWARHENPWSVWTRVAVLPLLTAAILWRAALGPAFWPVLAALLAFTWANPRLFPPPADRGGWSPLAVRGERMWLERRGPAPLLRAADRLAPLPALGAPVWLWGLYAGDAALAFLGALSVAALKLYWLERTARIARTEEIPC